MRHLARCGFRYDPTDIGSTPDRHSRGWHPFGIILHCSFPARERLYDEKFPCLVAGIGRTQSQVLTHLHQSDVRANRNREWIERAITLAILKKINMSDRQLVCERWLFDFPRPVWNTSWKI